MTSFLSIPSPLKKSSSVNMNDIHSIRDRAYIEELLETMFEEQKDHAYCKFTDSYTKYREVVAEWMIDVTEYFNLHITTTHAAVAYLDRLQPNEQFSRFEWQMLAICCILISSKFHECEEHVPALRKLEDITQQTITTDCVLSYELWALKKMSWKLNARTPVAFLTSYMKLGYVYGIGGSLPMTTDEEDDLNRNMMSLATKCVIQTEFKHIPASLMAACIAYYARRSADIYPVWTPYMTQVMFHDPARDPMGLQALEKIFSMEDNSAGYEELMLTLQDSMRSPVSTKRDSSCDHDKENFYDDEYDHEEMESMCNKLQTVFSDVQSPAPMAKSFANRPSPTSVVDLLM